MGRADPGIFDRPTAPVCRRLSSTQREYGRAAPATPQPIVNLAFLVAREALDEFRRCVERANLEHRDHGLGTRAHGAVAAL